MFAHHADPLGQLCQLDVDGTPIVELLAEVGEGSSEAAAELARYGIAWRAQRLTVDAHNPALGKLLISLLLRADGAEMGVDSGLLSLPLLNGNDNGQID
jgi:hypothetical protein